MSLIQDLRDARERGWRHGLSLYCSGLLPVQHPAPLPGLQMSRRRRACMEVYDKALFDGYLSAAAGAGATVGAQA